MTSNMAVVNKEADWLQRLLGRNTRPPAVPAGRRVFAVGDIHGRRDLLDRLTGQIRTYGKTAGPAQNTLIFLGDYIDRGPHSKGVIAYLLELDLPGWEIVFLRGNHDQSLLDFLDDANLYRAWRNFGGAETLLSYGVMPPRFDDEKAFARARDELAQMCPPAHLRFFRDLKNLHQEGDYLFVHAGIRPGIPIERQVPEDLLWIRDDFLLSNRLSSRVVVHGHTPAPSPVRRRNRICLDTGAHATGCLTAAVLEGEGCTFLATGRATADAVPFLG